MIAKVRNFSTAVSVPVLTGMDAEVQYQRLSERVCFSPRDCDLVAQALKLILGSGERPLCVIFEPARPQGEARHGG